MESADSKGGLVYCGDWKERIVRPVSWSDVILLYEGRDGVMDDGVVDTIVAVGLGIPNSSSSTVKRFLLHAVS